MVARESAAAGRGRPVHRYSLTLLGVRSAGDNYSELAQVLWDEVRSLYADMTDAKTRGYLIEGQKYLVVFADDVVAGIELPANIIMTITDSPAGVKGDSANNVYKEAITESGMRVQVPLFIGAVLLAVFLGWLFRQSPRSLLDNQPLRELLEAQLDFGAIG